MRTFLKVWKFVLLYVFPALACALLVWAYLK